ncbi:MAG TPA: hypothetical protein VLB82_09170 [Thermodesulfobacteriota bacterium]|nr:hypothetical protein [Thermodesulfobacteriota bacterium]
MRLFSILAVFVLAGLFLVALTDNTVAGIPGQGICKIDCQGIAEMEADAFVDTDCEGLRGEDRKECQIFRNIIVKCFYVECLEEECGMDEVPEESSICEVLDELCLDQE